MLSENNYKIFGTCSEPKIVFNKYTHEEMFVSCGRCPACVNMAANTQAMRVKDEILSHRYAFFFTLTYNNEFLPRFECITDKNGYPQFRPIGRCEFEFDSCPLNYVKPTDGWLRFGDDTELPPIQGEDGSLQYGVCCKRDIQNFMKRLRKLIFNDINLNEDGKKIRYYIASEYGPKTFRPHYHGIIFFDDAYLSTKIANYIVQAWSVRVRVGGGRNCFETRPFADISRTLAYIKKCDEKTAFYVARYVASNFDLPPILAERSSKPFHLCSKSPVIGSYKKERVDVLEAISNGTYRTSREIFNEKLGRFEHFDIPLNRDVCSSLFRKCKGFGDLSFDEKLRMYSFYGQHREEWRQSSYLAFIQWKFETRSFSADFADFLQSNRGWKYHCWIETNYPSEFYSMEMNLPQNWYSSRLAWHVVNTYSMSSFYPWLDPYIAYVRLFDKLELLKFSDIMLNFYQLFNDMVEDGFVDFQTAMLGAYPLMYKSLPLYHPYYTHTSASDVGNIHSNPYTAVFLGPMSDWSSFYLGGILYQPFLRRKSFYSSSFVKSYRLQQQLKLDNCNKSKKLHNTLINSVRAID